MKKTALPIGVLLVLLVLLAVMGLAKKTVYAQQAVKPYVHIIVDTSGSMDDSAGEGLESRMQEAKEALSDVFSGIGEVWFALQTFLETTSYCTNECNCVDNDHCEQGGAILVDYGPNNADSLYHSVDGVCSPGDGHYELAAYGSTTVYNTPLYRNLSRAHDHLTDTVMPNDEKSYCRPYVVVMITDGEENCDTCQDGVNEITSMLQDNIKTYLVGFSSADMECLNDMAEVRDPAAEAIEANDRDQLALAFQQIIEDSILVEICNNLDDDCDDLIDEGFVKYCDLPNGVTELTLCEDPGDPCDGVDDNCANGIEDELRNACGTCGEAPEEVCDYQDNDCDGYIDEGLDCDGDCEPSEEVCDGIDNDCDGSVDESDPNAGKECGLSEGPCEPGRLRCINGQLECIGGTLPRDEVCDGVDNDCDGEIDNEAPCPGDSVCIEGDCRRPCDLKSEFPCPVGFVCLDVEDFGFYCMPSACGVCGPTERCIDETCVDACDSVECEEGLTCINGACLTCRTIGCPDGELCIGDTCVKSPCAEVQCPDGEGCLNGTCHPLCSEKECGEGKICDENWECAEDGCDLTCLEHEYCDEGECRPDPCLDLNCRSDEVCVPDNGCVIDPCIHVNCPTDQKCSVSETGIPQCEKVDRIKNSEVKTDSEEQYVYAAGGGQLGSCTVAYWNGSDSVVLIFGLGFFFLLALSFRSKAP